MNKWIMNTMLAALGVISAISMSLEDARACACNLYGEEEICSGDCCIATGPAECVCYFKGQGNCS